MMSTKDLILASMFHVCKSIFLVRWTHTYIYDLFPGFVSPCHPPNEALSLLVPPTSPMVVDPPLDSKPLPLGPVHPPCPAYKRNHASSLQARSGHSKRDGQQQFLQLYSSPRTPHGLSPRDCHHHLTGTGPFAAELELLLEDVPDRGGDRPGGDGVRGASQPPQRRLHHPPPFPRLLRAGERDCEGVNPACSFVLNCSIYNA